MMGFKPKVTKCAVCGTNAVIMRMRFMGSPHALVQVYCGNKGCTSIASMFKDSDIDAIKAWNNDQQRLRCVRS